MQDTHVSIWPNKWSYNWFIKGFIFHLYFFTIGSSEDFAYYSYPLLAPPPLFYDIEFQNIAYFTIRAQLRKLELNENLSKSSNTITM